MPCSIHPVVGLALLVCFTGGEALASERPNVLFIAVDDLNDWIGCLGGHPQTRTPNLDRLAARGTLFRNAHCQGTMCNPSRVSLLWGRRPSSTGFYDNHFHVSKVPEFLASHRSLPAHFGANGYRTMTAGKIFHAGADLKRHFRVLGPRPGQWQKGLDRAVHEKPKGWHRIWDFGPQDYDEAKFIDHLTATWAVRQLETEQPTPFFLALGFYRPHVPFFSPRRVYETVRDAQLPPVMEADWQDIPAAARGVSMSNPKIPTHEWMKEEGRWEIWQYGPTSPASTG